MKVKNSRAAGSTVSLDYPPVHRKEFADSQMPFERQFMSLGQEQFEQSIADLANRIDEQGRRLSKKIDIAEMEHYRSLISEFLNEVVSNAYSFYRENTYDQRGRRKVYATVKKINEKLEEMAQELLSSNRDTIKIISSIDDIRGLILDIFL